MYEELTQPTAHAVDRPLIARTATEWTDLGMRRVMAFRDGGGNDGRFFDIRFEEFQSDPLAAIERLYVFLGEELTAEARSNMERWWQESADEKAPRPSYHLDGFGLDFEALADRFRSYSARFAISVRKAA
jgi:Sulfotransferase family